MGYFPVLAAVVVLFAWWNSSSSPPAELCQCGKLLGAPLYPTMVFGPVVPPFGSFSLALILHSFFLIVMVVPWRLQCVVGSNGATIMHHSTKFRTWQLISEKDFLDKIKYSRFDIFCGN
jgi:hypothetical protein